MPAHSRFRQLKPDQVQVLLNPAANDLRKNYLDILTLLQDLLGRYSSIGNATVFIDINEIDRLLYETYKKIQPQTKKFYNESGDVSSLDFVRLRKDSVRRWSDEHHRPSPFTHYVQGIRIDVPYKEFGFFTANYQFFDIDNFTIDDYKKLPFNKGTLSEYKRFIAEVRRIIAISLAQKWPQDYDSLSETNKLLITVVADCASTNIATASLLKSTYEKSKKSTKSIVNAIDTFLDGLLQEYELLRRPSKFNSEPPKSSRSKTRLKKQNKTVRD